MAAAIKRTPAMEPMTIPAMAPPERPLPLGSPAIGPVMTGVAGTGTSEEAMGCTSGAVDGGAATVAPVVDAMAAW